MIAIALECIDTTLANGRDDEIYAAAMEALSSSKYVPLRKLRCRVFEGVVEISGCVSSFYLKQLAQAAVMQLNGIVRNNVEVTGEPAALVATSCASS